MMIKPILYFNILLPVLSSGSEVRGLKPGRGRWIFSSLKILSMTSFLREVKPWVPCYIFTALKKPQAEITASEQNLSDFSRSMSEAMLNALDQRWPELIRDLESGTGSYSRTRTGVAGDVHIPRYQCRPEN